MLDPHQLLLAVPLLPVLGALLCALFGSVKQLKFWSHVPAVLCAGIVGLAAVMPKSDADLATAE